MGKLHELSLSDVLQVVVKVKGKAAALLQKQEITLSIRAPAVRDPNQRAALDGEIVGWGESEGCRWQPHSPPEPGLVT